MGTGRVSRVFASALLEHYRRTLDEALQVGFAAYAAEQLRPYVQAASAQFSPERQSLTEVWLEKAGIDLPARRV